MKIILLALIILPVFAQDQKTIVFVSGPKDHGRMGNARHEYEKDLAVLKACIESSGVAGVRKLAGAIHQLPENQRQVLLLRYYSNLKFIEIAEVVGCPLNTALGRMHKAMLKLKELMGSC